MIYVKHLNIIFKDTYLDFITYTDTYFADLKQTYLYTYRMSFDPEAFLKSLRRDLPSDPDYLTQTFEDYLKKKDLWETYKDRVNKRFEKYDDEVSYHRMEYNSEMKRRREEKQDPNDLKTFDKLFPKKEPEEDPEAKRLAHISEFGH